MKKRGKEKRDPIRIVFLSPSLCNSWSCQVLLYDVHIRDQFTQLNAIRQHLKRDIKQRPLSSLERCIFISFVEGEGGERIGLYIGNVRDDVVTRYWIIIHTVRIPGFSLEFQSASTSSIDFSFFDLSLSYLSLVCLRDALLVAYERISNKLTTLFFFLLFLVKSMPFK